MRILIKCLREAGYSDKSNPHKRLKKLFEAAVSIAAENYGIYRSASCWKKKFDRERGLYSEYILATSSIGAGGDNIPPKPAFSELMHELERNKARHDPPVVFSTHDLTNLASTSASRTSTSKRVCHKQGLTFEENDQRDEKRHAELMEQFRASTQHKKEINGVIRVIARKF